MYKSIGFETKHGAKTLVAESRPEGPRLIATKVFADVLSLQNRLISY